MNGEIACRKSSNSQKSVIPILVETAVLPRRGKVFSRIVTSCGDQFMASLCRAIFHRLGIFALFIAGPSFAADCPSPQKPDQPFRVSVGNRSSSEVYRLDSGETRTVTRFSGGIILEQTYHQGLIQVEHIAGGKRTLYTPLTNLKALFPMKVGQTHRVDFDVQTPDGKKRVMHAEYKVVGKDQLHIGPCRYEVLKVEHSNRFGEGPLIFSNTDWYAPDLRLIVAREFKRGNSTNVIKYDAISLSDGAPAR
jgi:hypothetical protein